MLYSTPFDVCRFREAGAEVIAVLSKFSDCVERASIDEAYIDLTEEVRKRMDTLGSDNISPEQLPNTFIVGWGDNKDGSMNDKDLLCFKLVYCQWWTLFDYVIHHYLQNSVVCKLSLNIQVKEVRELVIGYSCCQATTVVTTQTKSCLLEQSLLRKCVLQFTRKLASDVLQG